MKNQSPYSSLNLTFDKFTDERGSLTICLSNYQDKLPFQIGRVFWITNVPKLAVRGCHAHRRCYEALVPIHGSFKVRLDDGVHLSQEVVLDRSDKGILIPPMLWCELYDFSEDAVCLCIASGDYDKEGYVNDYEEFKQSKI